MQSVIALGFFDGVHLGHAALLAAVRKRADALGLRAVALSFDIHPDALVRGRPMPLLSTAAQRERLLLDAGMDEVQLLHFDAAFMHMPWQTFLDDVLIRRFSARHLVCGDDYRFGDRGAGTAQLLAKACADRGVGCDIVDKVALDGVTVSSTHIRELLLAGDAGQAARFLGRPYRLTGRVVHGNGLGRAWGTPTANLLPDPSLLLPKRGVYITRALCAAGDYAAVTNVGTRPTVDGQGVRVEAWLPDFDGDLYGQDISLDFYAYARPERKFDSVQALREEIMKNAEQARAFFAARAEREEP